MGRHGRPPLSRRELQGAYREARKEISRLRDQVNELVQDNIRMSDRLAEIDLSQDRLDLVISPVEPEDFFVPLDPVPVDLVKRPIYPGISSVDAVADMRAFMIRIHEAAGDTTAVQELRIL